MNARVLLSALAISIVLCGLKTQAQDNGTPKESTATLETTLSWLGRHVEANFTLGYATVESSDGTTTASHHEAVITRVPVRFEDCNVSWRDGDDVITVPLSAIDLRSVVVVSHTQPNTTFDSEIWKLALLTTSRKKVIPVQRSGAAIQSENSVDLLYDNKESAERFARALQHAIKLCVEKMPSTRN